MEEQKELIITTGIGKIEAIADTMRAFYPENDSSFKETDIPGIMRRYGEVILTITSDILHQLDF